MQTELVNIILAIAIIAEALIIVYLSKVINGFNERLKKLKNDISFQRASTSDISSHGRKIKVIENEIKRINKEMPKRSQTKSETDISSNIQKIETADSDSKKPVSTVDGESTPKTVPKTGQAIPDKKETPKKDNRIWAHRSEEGILKLITKDDPSDIYLQPKDKIYLLHITKLDLANFANMTILYKDILDIPKDIGSASVITMEVYPEYEKKNEFYVFKSKGKLKLIQ